MRAILDQATALDGDYTICKSKRRETVRDDDHGPPARHLRHILLHDTLAFIIERTRRLVENEYAGICDERASNSDALTLSARQGATTLADDGVIALGKLEDEIVGSCELWRRP